MDQGGFLRLFYDRLDTSPGFVHQGGEARLRKSPSKNLYPLFLIRLMKSGLFNRLSKVWSR